MSNVKQVIVVRKDLNMRKGKIAAQVAHASCAFFVKYLVNRKLITSEEVSWLSDNISTKIVVGVNSEQELLNLINKATISNVRCYPVTDLGLTEFKGNATLTCASFGPCNSDALDQITGHLQLL